MCARTHSNDINHDFDGFRFLEYGGKETELAATCNWRKEEDAFFFDLRGKRLVGFRIVTDNYIRGWRNIRQICPLVDPPDCSETTFLEDGLSNMEAEIPIVE